MLKQLEQHLNSGLKTELNVKKKQEIEYLLEGTIKPKKSHTIFEIDRLTGKAIRAQYKVDTVILGTNEKGKEKLIINPNCIYIPALNVENAEKKFKNNPNQSAYYYKHAPMNINDLNFNL